MTLKFNSVLDVVDVQNFAQLSAAVHKLSCWRRNRETNLATMLKTVGYCRRYRRK